MCHWAFAQLRTAFAPGDITVVVEVHVRVLSQPVPCLGTLDVSNVHVVTGLSLEPLAWLRPCDVGDVHSITNEARRGGRLRGPRLHDLDGLARSHLRDARLAHLGVDVEAALGARHGLAGERGVEVLLQLHALFHAPAGRSHAIFRRLVIHFNMGNCCSDSYHKNEFEHI